MFEFDLKQYIAKNALSTAVTAEESYIAVALQKEDVCIFCRLL